MDFNPFEPQVKTDSILLNNAIGVGTGRDKMAGTTVNPGYFSTRLSLEERSALFAGDSFIHKLCAAIPTKAAARGWYCKITDDDGDDISDEVEEYRKGLATNSDVDLTVDGRRFNSIEDLFRIAQVFANYQDGALLILNIDDGRPPHEPVNHKGIRRIAGIEVVSRRYCRPSLESASNVLDPVFYELVSLRRGTATIEAPNDRLEGFAPKKAGDGRVKIHCSRVIRFDGSEPLDETYVIANEGWYGNQIDRVWDYYKCWKTGQDALGSTLADSSLFVYKLRGLGNMIAQGKQGSISKRLAILTQNASMNGGVALDADAESIEYSSRQQNGVADILESFKNVMVGATGLPHTILLGESPSGLGATGESEQQQLQELVTEQQILWKPGIERLYRLIFLSKDGPTKGKIPEQWEVVFKPLREQNEMERIQNLSAFVNVLATGVGSAFLTAEEARASFDGETEFNIKLDDKAWQEQKKKEEEQMGGGAFGGGDFGGGEFGAGEAAPAEEMPAEEAPAEEEQVQTDSRLDSEVPYKEDTQFTIVAEVPNYETEAWKAATHRFAVLDSAYAQDYMRDAAIEMERMDKSIADRHGLTKKKIRGKDGVTRTYWVKKGLLESPKRRYFGKSNYITGGGNKYITGKDDNTEKLLAIGVGSALLAGGVGLVAWEQQRQKEMDEFDRRRAAAVNGTPRPGTNPPPAPSPAGPNNNPRPGTSPPPPPQSPSPPPPPPAPTPAPAPAASPPATKPRRQKAAPSPAAPGPVRVKVSRPKNAAYKGQFSYERGVAAIIRDGKPHRQYQYESPAHGTVPVLGRLNASNRVNGGYYTINGVETQIDKGDLSTIGKEIDNVPPAPPTPPTPRIPPAPPAAPGPSSTPSSSQGKKGRPGKPSAPSGGGGGPAAILPPAIEPVPIVDPTGQTALDIPGMDFLNPPRQRPSAVTGLDDPNQATPPPGQMDPDFSQSVAEPDPESLPPTPRVQPTPYSHVPGIGSARASAAGGIGLALGYASKGEVAILRNSEAFPWAVRAGLVDSDGRLTPEGEVFRERDPYVSTLRGKSLVVARLAEGSDALARDIRVMHESWFALSSEGEGGGDAIALLARRISSRERIGETVAKKRAKRVLELHESLGLGVNSTRGARGRKSFAVGELDIRDAAPAVVYSVALKAEAGTGELPSRSLEADLETTLFGYNTSTTSGNDIYNWADYNLTIERQRAVAPYQVIWRQGHRFGLNSVSILDHLLSVDW